MRKLSTAAPNAGAPRGGATPPNVPTRPGTVPPAPRPPVEQPAQTHESVNLRELISVLLRRRWLILGVTALITGVAVYLGHGLKPMYSAQASVRLANPRRAITSSLADESQQTSDYNEDRRVSKIQVLTSRTLVTTAVNQDPTRFRLRLDGAPIAVLRNVTVAPDAVADSVVLAFGPQGVAARSQQGSVTAPYGVPLDVAGARFVVLSQPLANRAVLHIVAADDAVGRVLAGLRAKQREQADVIDVSYTGTDPHFAQDAVNGLVKTFAAGDVQDAQDMSKRRRIFVAEQLRRNDSLLAVAQGALAGFRARTGTFSAKDQFSTEQHDLAGLGTQRETLVSERAAYQALLAGVERARTAAGADRGRALPAVPAVGDNAVITQLYGQLATYETRRDSLTTGPWAHAATHPDVLQIDTLIVAAERKIGEAARAQLATLDGRIQRVDQLASQNTSALQRLPAVEAEELRLSNEVESLSKLGQQLREEYQKAQISEAVQVGQVEILDLAVLPTQPVGSGPTPRIVVGLIVGLALGCGAAFLRERLDTTISRRSELQDLLGLSPLALVPRNRSANRGLLARLRRGRGDRSEALAPLDRAVAEAYVTLRTNLLYSQAAGAPRTIVVTSSAPGDGKTTVSSSLARIYAQQGSRVLLMDCDLRRSRLHRVFGLRPQPGMTELLLGIAADADAISATGVPNLSVLPAGRTPDNPAELMGGPAMDALLDRVRDAFDVVILDTAPTLAVADAAILGAKADGVVFVVRAGTTERDAARAALDQLSSVGARVVGAVLNDPDDHVANYPGYYYYSEYYTRPASSAA